MIRVLHSVSNMDRGGIETMIMNYYRRMDRSRVQFDFWCNKQKPGDYDAEIEAMGGHIYRATGYNPLHFGRYLRAMGEVLQRNPDIRILHVHNGALGLYALEAARRSGLSHRLYSAHSTRIPEGKTRAFKRCLKPFIRFAATEKLACGADSAQFYYGSRCAREGNYTLVPNAIALDAYDFDPTARAQVRQANGWAGKTVLGHVGRFSLVKNHSRLLDIFARFHQQHPDSVLVLLGEGELQSSVRDKARALGLEGCVQMPGSVADAARWYQAMDAFVMPSLYEGLPVVLVEAQTAGLPCVVSDTVTREMDACGLIRYVSLSQSDAAWCDAIEQALETSANRRGFVDTMSRAGYNIGLEAPKLQDLYIRLAAPVPRG